MNRLASDPSLQGAAVLIPSAPEYYRNHDVHHAYRQDSNFYYLTGFDEPESFLALLPSSAAGRTYKTVLFVRKRDPLKEMWEGERYGIEGALSIFGVDEAYLIHEIATRLPELLRDSGAVKIYYPMGRDAQASAVLEEQPLSQNDQFLLRTLNTVKKFAGRSGRGLLPIEDAQHLIGELRLFKSPEEIEALKKACSISARAHRTLMQSVKPGMNEYEMEALIDYEFRRQGCQRLGYGSIVAGGVNAACLHYRANNAPLNDGELLLVDAGGEYDYYTADITRAFPIGTGFTVPQKQLYEIVLKSQLEGIAIAKPGSTMQAIHSKVTEVLVEGLLSLGLLKGSAKEIIRLGEHRRFYPHSTGHWLGMDVHDAGLYMIDQEPRLLEAGMCLTIEPGLYVQPNDSLTPAEYHHIGIRIEDDILITANGCEVLTHEVPKTISDIEALKS
jgi:Xaa-Pro aminopeptidase